MQKRNHKLNTRVYMGTQKTRAAGGLRATHVQRRFGWPRTGWRPSYSCAQVGIGRLGALIVVRISVAVWAGHVENDFYWLIFAGLGVEFVIDGGEGAKELVGDVGEDGGAACGYFIFGEEEKEASEKFIDGNGGAEFPEVGGEDGGTFRGVLLILGELGVSGAVGGIKGSDVEAATLAVGEAMRATSGVVDGARVSDLLGHFSFLGWIRGYTPGATQKILKTRELREKQFVRP